jgi:3-oxoacid CoA-transferase subunit B
METAITGDFAIVKGWKADHFGNVIYRHTAQNFNPLMATAGRITVVEVEEIVAPGEAGSGGDPHPRHLRRSADPGHLREAYRTTHPAGIRRIRMLTREQMAQRVAQELRGRLLRQPGHRHPDVGGQLRAGGHGRDAAVGNGLLGMGEFPTEQQLDADMINAGKQTVTARLGASIFDSAQSFAMIRGGHVDLTVLGAFEVDVEGNIASWMIPGKMVKGMGGAMDLVAGAENIIVVMTHAAKGGESKLLPRCTLPLTGANCIRKVLTDLAYLEIEDGAFVLRERAPGVSVAEIVAKTAGRLIVPEQVPEMRF